jgi:hypothetical protein
VSPTPIAAATAAAAPTATHLRRRTLPSRLV